MKVLVANYSRWIAWNIPASEVERLRATFPDIRFDVAANPEHAVAAIPDAEVAYSSVLRPDMLAAARRLRWIHSPAAGVGGMLFPEMIARDVVITNARGMHARTIAEHVVAVTLALFRHLPAAARAQIERRWIQDELTLASPRVLAGATIGVVGLGAIGAAVAKTMSALGAGVEAIRRRVDLPSPDGVESVHAPSSLGERLPRWDVAVICAPHTPETEGLIGTRELALMKRDAVLVNVARGRLIDEEALADALRRGTIGGAALDVFDREPLEPDSPLWAVPNLLITPHVAGNRPDYWRVATDLFVENLRRYRAGQPLINVVDKEAGY